MVAELSRQEIDEVLSTNFIGRLACASEEEVYIIPLAFAWDGTRLIFQTTLGKKIEIMRRNPKVCFQTDQIADLSKWKSVIVRGTYTELIEEEKPAAGRLLIDRISQHFDGEGRSPRDITPDKLGGRNQTVLFAIVPDEVTGRFERPD